jgi:hypothetical protein
MVPSASPLAPESVVNPTQMTGPHHVTQSFALGSTTKTDHKSDELMLHDNGPKNLEGICAYNLHKVMGSHPSTSD